MPQKKSNLITAFVRVLFESCSRVVRELFEFCSGIVRVGFGSGSGQAGDKFETSSRQVRHKFVSALVPAEKMSKKSQRNVEEISLLSAFSQLFGIDLIRSKVECLSKNFQSCLENDSF